MRDELIVEEMLGSLVEQNQAIKDGKKFYLEQIMENKRWPSDERLVKDKVKSTVN
jgi:hypothetical protein